MALLSINDRVANYREKFKTSESERIRKLNLKEIKELIKLQAEIDAEILVASQEPKNKFDTISLGFGTLKIVTRDPMQFRNVHTKELEMTSYTPLFYFTPTDEVKRRVKKKLNEVKQRELEVLGEGED